MTISDRIRSLPTLDLTVPYDYADLIVSPSVEGYDEDRIKEVLYLIEKGHIAFFSWVDSAERAYNAPVTLSHLDRVLVQTIPRATIPEGFTAGDGITEEEDREAAEALLAHLSQEVEGFVQGGKGKDHRLGFIAKVWRTRQTEGKEPSKFTINAKAFPFVRDNLNRYVDFKTWRSNWASFGYGDAVQESVQERLLGRKDLWDALQSELAVVDKSGLANLLEGVNADEAIIPTSRRKGAAARAAAVEDEGPIVAKRGARKAPAATAAAIEDEAIVPARRGRKASA